MQQKSVLGLERKIQNNHSFYIYIYFTDDSIFYLESTKNQILISGINKKI